MISKDSGEFMLIVGAAFFIASMFIFVMATAGIFDVKCPPGLSYDYDMGCCAYEINHLNMDGSWKGSEIFCVDWENDCKQEGFNGR